MKASATTLRRVTIADLPRLAALARCTFAATFAATCRPESLRHHQQTVLSEHAFAAKLADPQSALWIAEAGERALGYLVVRVDDPRPGGNEQAHLERIYLRSEMHGTGLSGRLMATALNHAAEAGAEGIWLGVWEHNDRALAFYRRWGFTEVGDQAYLLGEESQRDLQLARALGPSYWRPMVVGDHSAVAAGLLRAYAAFDAVGEGYGPSDPDMEDLPTWYAKPGWAYGVICHGSQIVGGAGIAPFGDSATATCELRKVWLDEAWRGQGWGRHLVERCMERARTLGYGQIYLETLPRMEAANRLYRQLGFQRLEQPLPGSQHRKCDQWYLRSLES